MAPGTDPSANSLGERTSTITYGPRTALSGMIFSVCGKPCTQSLLGIQVALISGGFIILSNGRPTAKFLQDPIPVPRLYHDLAWLTTLCLLYTSDAADE